MKKTIEQNLIDYIKRTSRDENGQLKLYSYYDLMNIGNNELLANTDGTKTNINSLEKKVIDIDDGMKYEIRNVVVWNDTTNMFLMRVSSGNKEISECVMLNEIKNLMSRICENYKPLAINEGVDIDFMEKTVSFNPNHEDNVNTSVDNNPTVEIIKIGQYEIPVYSIFQRNNNINTADGNPLIYAYKNEKGWKFRTLRDRSTIDRQFKLIAQKFMNQYKGGKLTIVLPTENTLNQTIAREMKAIDKSLTIYDGWLRKLTTEEVYDLCIERGSNFRQTYNTKGKFETALLTLNKYLDDMDKYHNGTYARHFVKDSTMRNAITRTMAFNSDDSTVKEFINSTNEADILIIDDTISRGDSILEACEILIDNVNIKSISVLTVMSKLY